jgi:hypothetical protein
MPRFRTVAVLTAVVGVALGVALAAIDPGYDVALAADAPTGGFLQSLARTFVRPLVQALNPAGGTTVKPGANADQKLQQQQQKQQQQPPKNNQQGTGGNAGK